MADSCQMHFWEPEHATRPCPLRLNLIDAAPGLPLLILCWCCCFCWHLWCQWQLETWLLNILTVLPAASASRHMSSALLVEKEVPPRAHAQILNCGMLGEYRSSTCGLNLRCPNGFWCKRCRWEAVASAVTLKKEFAQVVQEVLIRMSINAAKVVCRCISWMVLGHCGQPHNPHLPFRGEHWPQFLAANRNQRPWFSDLFLQKGLKSDGKLVWLLVSEGPKNTSEPANMIVSLLVLTSINSPWDGCGNSSRRWDVHRSICWLESNDPQPDVRPTHCLAEKYRKMRVRKLEETHCCCPASVPASHARALSWGWEWRWGWGWLGW